MGDRQAWPPPGGWLPPWCSALARESPRITTPQGEFPQVQQVISGIAMVRGIVSKAEKIWVGR